MAKVNPGILLKIVNLDKSTTYVQKSGPGATFWTFSTPDESRLNDVDLGDVFNWITDLTLKHGKDSFGEVRIVELQVPGKSVAARRGHGQEDRISKNMRGLCSFESADFTRGMFRIIVAGHPTPPRRPAGATFVTHHRMTAQYHSKTLAVAVDFRRVTLGSERDVGRAV
jgi:hypothetical protein